MAITSGQSRARAALLAEQNRDAEDWTMEDGPAQGWDAIGRVQYSSNPGDRKGVGTKGASLLNEQLLNQYVSQGPKGLKVGDFMNKVDNGLDTTSLAYGQSVKDSRVADLQQASDWWDEHPNGKEPSWLDKHGFALTATIMAMGAGAALLAGGAAGGGGAAAAGGGGSAGAGTAGAAGIGSGGAGAGLGAAEIGAGGAGAVGAGGAGAASAIPQVIITGSAGGGAGVGLGTAAGYGAAGAGAAYGLGSMGSGGTGTGSTGSQPTTSDQPMQQVEIKGERPTDLGLGQYANDVGNAGAVGGALSQMPNYNSGTSEQSTWDQVKDKLGGMSADDWGKVVNGGLGLIGGNVDRIKANQDADWWKSQLDTLQGMYKPGTLEADQMQQKMEAQDAAAGRRSQYGIRAVNLASNLAEKRAGIMTSAGYQNMANAYRNRSSQDLNGLFAAAGQAGGTNGTNWGSLISGLGSLYSTYAGGSTPSPKPQITAPTR